MSDLTATNCGCGCDAPSTGNSGGCNLIWLIFLLCICGGNGSSICGGNSGCGNFFSGDNNCLFLILLLCCCGNGCF